MLNGELQTRLTIRPVVIAPLRLRPACPSVPGQCIGKRGLIGSKRVLAVRQPLRQGYGAADAGFGLLSQPK